MAVESLSNIKAETGRDLTGLTNDNTLLFAETSNGTDGVATVAELTKGCMKETNGTVTGDHNFTGSLKVGGEDVLTEDDVTNTVENGNMFPVTSNAVNGAISNKVDNSKFPNFGKESIIKNRQDEGIVTINALDSTTTGLSIDIDINTNSMRVYKEVNGTVTKIVTFNGTSN